MDNNNGDSSANTVLIIVVLVILVGFVIWWFGGFRSAPAAPQNPGLNIDVQLPSGDNTPSTTGNTQPAQ